MPDAPYNYQGGVNTLLTRPSVPIIDFLAIRRGQQMREDTDRLDRVRSLQDLRENDWEENRANNRAAQEFTSNWANELQRRKMNGEDIYDAMTNMYNGLDSNAQFNAYNPLVQAKIYQQLGQMGNVHLQNAINAGNIGAAQKLSALTGTPVNFAKMYAGIGDAQSAVAELQKMNPNVKYELSKDKSQIFVNGVGFDTASFLQSLVTNSTYGRQQALSDEQRKIMQQIAAEDRGMAREKERLNMLKNANTVAGGAAETAATGEAAEAANDEAVAAQAGEEESELAQLQKLQEQQEAIIAAQTGVPTQSQIDRGARAEDYAAFSNAKGETVIYPGVLGDEGAALRTALENARGKQQTPYQELAAKVEDLRGQYGTQFKEIFGEELPQLRKESNKNLTYNDNVRRIVSAANQLQINMARNPNSAQTQSNKLLIQALLNEMELDHGRAGGLGRARRILARRG